MVAPRNMRFSPSRATSIDLHIHETVRWSRYRDSITVFAEEVDDPFTDTAVRFWPKGAGTAQIRKLVEAYDPTLVVVHQHLPTASALAGAFRDVPVVLVRHNFQKPPRNRLSGFFKRRQMNRLAGIAFVSECCLDDFKRVWPDIRVPTSVVLNGIDSAAWHPAGLKDPVVLFVGRLAPEKGALEAAEAMVGTLLDRSGWQGVFVASSAPEHPEYALRVKSVIAGSGGRIGLLSDIDHDAVRALMSRAAISLAPTQNREPFGRVAVEALASGTVLIASASGGFVEIVGKAGILLDEPNADNIAAALGRLIDDDAERNRLSVAGRAQVTPRYDLSRTVATFDALAARLLPAAS